MDSLSRKRRLSGSTSTAPRSFPRGQPAFSTAIHHTSVPEAPTHIHSQTIQNGGSGSIAIGRDNIAVTGDLYMGSNGPGEDAACLRDLRATDPRHDKIRIEQTKGGLLPASYRWILDNAEFRQWRDDPETHLLRIMGDPGKGKSMLLCGIIDELTPVTGRSLSYFFCQDTDARINSATAVLRGLIYMLVGQQPSLIGHLRKQYDHAGRALFEDANAWIALSEILTDILRDPALPPVFIVIDALDECTKDLPSLLGFISRTVGKSPAKWLVSSRNNIDIERGLRLNPSGARLSLELRENAEQVAHAVDAYIDYCVSQLLVISDVALEGQVKDKLRQKADGTFLWVSLVVPELRDTMSLDMLEVIEETPSDLTSVYRRMMDRLQRLPRGSGRCLEILSVVVTAYRPLHLKELRVLSKLLERCSTDDCRQAVAMCGSFLTVREEHVYIVHQSAKDFLSADASLFILPSRVGRVHHGIVYRSLQCLSTTLRRDIYNLRQPGAAIEDAIIPSPDPLFDVRYACTYWIRHLLEPNAGLQDDDIMNSVATFLQIHFLHWLEGLSLVKQLPGAVVSLSRLASEVLGHLPIELRNTGLSAPIPITNMEDNSLYGFLQDAYRFTMYYRWVIENYPLQVYASALVFSPARSRVRMTFRHEEPTWLKMKPAMEDQWNACLQTLEGHSDEVNSVVFSHDGCRLASASSDNTVKVWDATTGQCLQTLEGHSDAVNSVVFSHDGCRLASASRDKTVKVWDATTGQCLQTLEGHSIGVNSVVFSHDDCRLASASRDKTVKVWDATTGQCLQTLEGHNSWVSSVVFSHDGCRLASASYDKTVKVWDATTGQCLQTLKGHSNEVNSVVFSHDGCRLASASSDNTVKVWDATTGQCLQTLEGHNSWVSSVVFSHDGCRLASASYDKTVKMWDATTGQCLQTLDMGMKVSHIEFNKQGDCLHTDLGTFTLLPTASEQASSILSTSFSHSSPNKQRYGYGLSADRTWILFDDEKWLWLPPEYRPTVSAVGKRRVAIGCASGRVLQWAF